MNISTIFYILHPNMDKSLSMEHHDAVLMHVKNGK